MTSNPPHSESSTPHGLAEAIAKNEDAAEAVQDAADELGVLHAVLIKEVAKIAEDGDIADAVKRTAELETKLTETAEKIAEVNQALAEQQASLEHLHKAK